MNDLCAPPPSDWIVQILHGLIFKLLTPKKVTSWGSARSVLGSDLDLEKKIPLNKGTFMENKKPIEHIRFGDPNIGIHGFTQTPMKSQKFRREVK